MIKYIIFILITVLNISAAYCQVEKLLILGGGPAGLTAAIFAGQAALNPLVISDHQPTGQLDAIEKVENFPGFPEGISGKELIERLRQQAENFGGRFAYATVVAVDLKSYPFKVTLSEGGSVLTESLILATGTSPKWLGIESEKSFWGKGISANARVDGPQFAGRKVVVVGGGDSAMEQALILAEQAVAVTILYRGKSFVASHYLQERVFSNSKITTMFNSEVVEIQDVAQGRLTAVVAKDLTSSRLFTIDCEGVFVANGRKPNTDLFKEQLDLNSNGQVIVKAGTAETNVAGVFAAGDIMDNPYKKMVTAAASGCMAAIDAIRFLKNKLDTPK